MESVHPARGRHPGTRWDVAVRSRVASSIAPVEHYPERLTSERASERERQNKATRLLESAHLDSWWSETNESPYGASDIPHFLDGCST